MVRKKLKLSGMVLAFTLWSVAGVAEAALGTVAVQDDESPETGFFYKDLQNPAVGSAVGPATEGLAFFARVRQGGTGKKCIFRVDETGAGSTIVCRQDISPDGRRFKTFSNPVINSGGTVAWASNVSGGVNGIYKGASPPTLVSLLGDPAPAGVAGLLNLLSLPAINDAGALVFKATISGAAVVGGVALDQGIFRCSGGDGNCSSGGSGTLTTLVLRNDPVPDRAGREFCGFTAVAASNFGIAFRAQTRPDCTLATGTREGIFRMPFGGAIETIALQNETSGPFPDLGGTDGTKYSSADGSLGSPLIENSGIVGFQALTSGIVTIRALYLCDPAASCPTFTTPPNGMPGDVIAETAVFQGQTDDDANTFQTLSEPALSDGGDIAFTAEGRTPGGKDTRGVYIRRFADGDIETIVLQGNSVPGVVPAAEFTSFVQPSMSADGKVAFKATIRATNPPRKRRVGIFLFQ